MTRSEFLTLTKMDVEVFKNLSRREQLPFRSEDDPDRKLGEYNLMDAYLQIISSDFAGEGISRTRAADIVRPLATALHLWLPEIVATGTALFNGHTPDNEVFCGRLSLNSGPIPFHALRSELGALLEKHRPIRIFSTSASRAMKVLMMRATWGGIALPAGTWNFRNDSSTEMAAPLADPQIDADDVYRRFNKANTGKGG